MSMVERVENAGRALAVVLVDELVRGGVTDACLSPGSRSAPLAIALAERPEIRLHVHIDERSASFLALGIAKASGRPCVMLTTSGTAAANVHPAIVEAHHGRVPLVVLTADRPPELRATGATQTIDQVKLFGDDVRFFAEVGAPSPGAGMVRYWRALASRALAAADGAPRGPVHLNVAFRDPLHPAPDEHGFPYALQGRPDGAPWTRTERAPRAPSESVLARIAEEAGASERGLVVAGGDEADPEAVTAFARAAGWPLVADPASGCRTGDHAITTAEALLRHEPFIAEHRPDLVVRFGRLGTSKPLLALLGPTVRQIVIDPDGGWNDPERVASLVVDADPSLTMDALSKAIVARSESGWLESWLASERRARAALDAALDSMGDAPFDGRVARDLAAGLPASAVLTVASSMPLRDLEWFMSARDGLRVLANRGANGIDGFVSTALGVALGHRAGPAFALCGDLAMLHDSNGLMAARREHIQCVFVVLNNDGGGIFSFLPYAGMPEFERLFGTPHGIDFADLAALHGVGFRRVERADELLHGVLEARGAGGVQIVEVTSDRATNVERHRLVWRAVADALS